MSTRVAPAPSPSSSASSALGRGGLSRRKIIAAGGAREPAAVAVTPGSTAATSWEASAGTRRRRQSLGSLTLLGLALASICACISDRLSDSARRIWRICTLLVLSCLVFAAPSAMMFTSLREWDATPKLLHWVRFGSSPTTLHIDLLDSSLRLIEGPPGSSITLQATSTTSSASACTVRHVGENGTRATSAKSHIGSPRPNANAAIGRWWREQWAAAPDS